jgi:glycosyltransferase involved in cell wall biosynthesis
MITGDRSLAQGKKGPFYYMLEEFSRYWERIDIICPKFRISNFEFRNNFQNSNVRIFFGNVYVHVSSLPKILHPWFILKTGEQIYREQKFDLFTIHSYPPFYNDLGGLWLHNKIKIPYILEIMHITGYPRAGNFKEWFYKVLTRLFIKDFAKKAKAVRIINQKQTGDFLRNSGLADKKLKYIPAFYIDFDIFKPQNLEKKYDIVFAGRLVKNKGINLLLKVIKIINQHNSIGFIEPISFIIVGDGPLKPKIQKFIQTNNLQDNIKLIGWLPNIEDVARIYNQSKIMVMPSLNEGGPRVCLEAMACKLPIITSRVGIMLDVIKDNESGLFIDWSAKDIVDKIMLLLKDSNLREKISGNGFRSVQGFERKKIIENYARSYKNLLYSAGI